MAGVQRYCAALSFARGLVVVVVVVVVSVLSFLGLPVPISGHQPHPHAHSGVNGDAPPINLWPAPAEMTASGDPITLSANFQITTASKSVRLAKAIRRYQQWIVPSSPDSESEHLHDVIQLTGLEISLNSGNENLTYNTSYGYSLHVTPDGGTAAILADTVYGAMYGLETFSQFVTGSKLNYSSLSVQDAPAYAHRGLMIDTGRRFFPPALVENLLDAMSYLKLNVLHFHLSDLCRFSIQSHLYPQLTSESQGYYTQDEIVQLVAYAKDRGIRVVPEFDVPGHSHGFEPLAASGDVVFCSGTQKQLCHDAQNKTITTLKRLFLEMATLFDDELFHIGCDETGTTASCPLSNTKALEVELVQYLRSVGRTPVGWEEILFGTGAASPESTVINTWSRHNAAETTPQGYRTIESSGRHFYVNHASTAYTQLWTDISDGVPAADTHLLVGGEFSMWSDNYCYITQCYIPSSKPVAAWMYNRTEDNAFTASVTAMIWPRGIVAAGSFWRYHADLDATSPEFVRVYDAQTQRLLARGIASCPAGCKCDELSQCGKPYPHSSSDHAQAKTVF